MLASSTESGNLFTESGLVGELSVQNSIQANKTSANTVPKQTPYIVYNQSPEI